MCHAWDPGFFSMHQGCGSEYYYAHLVSKSKNLWMASNVSLVESESCAPLIPLVGELLTSNWYQQVFLKCRTIFLFFHSRTPNAGDPERCWRTSSPVYIIVTSLCPAFLKHIIFYKAHCSEKRSVFSLPSYTVRCDWLNTSSVRLKCYDPYHILKHTASPWHGSGGDNTKARIKVMPLRKHLGGVANLPTKWRRYVGACLNEPFQEGVDE